MYVQFLDSDDIFYPNMLEVIFDNIEKGFDWVSYDWHCEGAKEGAYQTQEPLMKNCATWAYTFDLDFIGDARFDESLKVGEDVEFLHRVLRDDCRHFHDNRVFYNYQWNRNPNSLSHRHARGEI